MAGMTQKDLDLVNKRMASVSGHFTPAAESGSIAMSNCSGRLNDSYHRVHGEVPGFIPEWTQVPDESGKPFTDIIYEKAIGEGIAKITINRPERRNSFRPPHMVKELMRHLPLISIVAASHVSSSPT